MLYLSDTFCCSSHKGLRRQSVSSHPLLSSRFSSTSNIMILSFSLAARSHRSSFSLPAYRQNMDRGTVTRSEAISFHKWLMLSIFWRLREGERTFGKASRQMAVEQKMFSVDFRWECLITFVNPSNECFSLRKADISCFAVWSSRLLYFWYTFKYLKNEM